MQRVEREHLGEFEVVRDAAGVLEVLVQIVRLARYGDGLPEFVAQPGDFLERVAQAPLVARHPHVVPQQLAEAPVELTRRFRPLDGEERVDPRLYGRLRFLECVVIGRNRGKRGAGDVVRERVRDHEVAVAETLHQRARAEPVGAMVGEVRFAEDVQSRQVAHQVVVNPQAAHRVMDRRVDPHRHLVRILVRDLLVHVEQVAVAHPDDVSAEPFDRVGEIQVHREAAVADAASLVADDFGVARRDVARHQVAEARILPLEVVIAFPVRNLLRRTGVARLFRHPDAAVVPQALRHQRELRLMRARNGDAGRMNLRVAGIREEGAALVRAPGRGHVRIDGVRRQVIRRPVAAGAEQHRVRDVPLQLAGRQVAADDPARLAVDDHEIEHLAVRKDPDRALLGLTHHRLVRAEQELLTRLAARVERARHLRAAERSVVEQPAVLARERHALRHALIDDVDAQLRQPEDVRFARPVVPAFDRVVEQPLDAVAVVLIVLRRVDAALRGDGMRAPRRVMKDEAFDVVAQLAHRRRSRGTRQPGADDDDVVLPLVRRVHQPRFETVTVPFFGERSAGCLRVERHRYLVR